MCRLEHLAASKKLPVANVNKYCEVDILNHDLNVYLAAIFIFCCKIANYIANVEYNLFVLSDIITILSLCSLYNIVSFICKNCETKWLSIWPYKWLEVVYLSTIVFFIFFTCGILASFLLIVMLLNFHQMNTR